jgi:pimeloyl-ACP methyl ester carboxylesterase
MDCAARSVTALRRRLDEAAEFDHGDEGVRIVGFSRGGQFARVAAQDRPVRALVTLGAPFELYRLGPAALLPAVAVATAGTLGAAHLASLQCLFGPCCATFRRSLRAPVHGPFTSVYSRQDRVVPWRTSVDPSARNVEVDASHMQLVSSAAVFRVLARELAVPASVAA